MLREHVAIVSEWRRVEVGDCHENVDYFRAQYLPVLDFALGNLFVVEEDARFDDDFDDVFHKLFSFRF